MAAQKPTESTHKLTTHSVRLDIVQAIHQLQAHIEQVRKLATGEIQFDDPLVDTRQKEIRDTIRDIFGADSPEYYDHSQHKIWHGGHIYLEARSKRQEKFIAGIPHTISMLEGLIQRLEDRRKILKDEAPGVAPQVESKVIEDTAKPQAIRKGSVVEATELPRRIMTKRVCVIHGQNDALKTAVVGYLEKLSLEPVVLHKQQNSDRNIIEKIESLPEVDFAVILLTADDFAQPGKPVRNGKLQAKRNVLFELGYYVGRLGKSRVCALYSGHGKPPRDHDGISCLTVSENQVWRRLLGLELKAAGFDLAAASIK
jgi:predicted nucleotide-binding protein